MVPQNKNMGGGQTQCNPKKIFFLEQSHHHTSLTCDSYHFSLFGGELPVDTIYSPKERGHTTHAYSFSL